MTTYLRTWALDDIHISRSGDGRTVTAYCAMFDAPYEVRDQHGHYMESIARSAFNKTLADKGTRGVACLFNHGLTVHGTPDGKLSVPLGTPLDIKPDGRGLLTVTRYNRGEVADLVLESIRNGDIRSQSFRGRIFRSSPERLPRMARGADLPTVVRHELGLSDYGPTPVPVNGAAEILAVRSQVLQLADALDDDERAELLDELSRHLPGRHRQGSHGNRFSTPGDRSSGLRRKGISKLDPPDDDRDDDKAGKAETPQDEPAKPAAPKVQIPHRADGKAKRGDIMVVEQTDTSYSVSKGRQESTSYKVYEVTSVSRDGEPLKVRNLQGYNGNPGSEMPTRVGYGANARPGFEFRGRRQIIPGDQVDAAGLTQTLNAHTYEGHPDSAKPFASLKDLGDAIRPHLSESGATPRPAPVNPSDQWDAIQKRLSSAKGGLHAQIRLFNAELAKPDLHPDNRRRMEDLKAKNADKFAAVEAGATAGSSPSAQAAAAGSLPQAASSSPSAQAEAADPEAEWADVSGRIRGACDLNAQARQIDQELSNPDLLPETRARLEQVKTREADRFSAAAGAADPARAVDPVLSRVDRINAAGRFSGNTDEILKGATLDELVSIGQQFGVKVDDLGSGRRKAGSFARSQLSNRIRDVVSERRRDQDRRARAMRSLAANLFDTDGFPTPDEAYGEEYTATPDPGAGAEEPPTAGHSGRLAIRRARLRMEMIQRGIR